MKASLKLIIAGCLAATLGGCIIVDGDHDRDHHSWRSEQKDNREIISGLALQTERTAVLNKLGSPSFSDAFTKGEDEYRILYYRTQHRHSDGDTTKDETTGLVFKNDKLIGWGEKILESIQ